jgi:hypothetical protein
MKFILFISILPAGACVLRADILSSDTNLTAREEQIIAAAKANATPEFNGARIMAFILERRWPIR